MTQSLADALVLACVPGTRLERAAQILDGVEYLTPEWNKAIGIMRDLLPAVPERSYTVGDFICKAYAGGSGVYRSRRAFKAAPAKQPEPSNLTEVLTAARAYEDRLVDVHTRLCRLLGVTDADVALEMLGRLAEMVPATINELREQALARRGSNRPTQPPPTP